VTDDKATVPDMHLVVGCLQQQQATVRETLRSLMPAALYADKLTIVTFEADTLAEPGDPTAATAAPVQARRRWSRGCRSRTRQPVRTS
jgi:hypothetical protein